MKCTGPLIRLLTVTTCHDGGSPSASVADTCEPETPRRLAKPGECKGCQQAHPRAPASEDDTSWGQAALSQPHRWHCGSLRCGPVHPAPACSAVIAIPPASFLASYLFCCKEGMWGIYHRALALTCAALASSVRREQPDRWPRGWGRRRRRVPAGSILEPLHLSSLAGGPGQIIRFLWDSGFSSGLLWNGLGGV